MSRTGYWQRRIGRRAALAGAASLGAAAIAAACAGSSSPRPQAGTPDNRGLLSAPQNTTGTARAGGVFKSFLVADVPSFDPLSSQSVLTHAHVAAYTYPRLVKFLPALYPDPAKGDVEGDLAESVELNGDKLQLTLRLRQGLKWEQRPPTNGRAIDAQDVVASWNRFLKQSPFKTDLAYDASLAPGSPIDTVTSPDPRTVLVKLKQPDASIVSLLGSDRLFYVLPREADAGFDPRVETRGYGPWLMTDNRPGSLRVWTKNPDYYVRGRPLPNSIEHAIVPEYASRLAQFRAGTIWPSVAGQDDIVAMKRELPQTVLRKSDTFSTTPSSLAFGYDGDAPWKDERLRQAVAMLIDREALIDLNTGHTGFREEGLNLDIRYHSVVGAGWEGYWIDPTDEKRFGDNARFFKYNPAEAKRLLSAAGLPDGFDTLLHYNGGSQYGPVYTRTAEIVSGMLSAGGIRARLDPRDYGDWLPNYHYAYTAAQNAGKPVRGFSGICYRVANSYPTVATQLFSTLHKDGARFEGMTPDGKNPQLGDPDVNQMLFAIRREFDVSKQQVLVQDFARFMARKAYDIPNLPFSALSYSLNWPVIGNLGVYRGWPAGTPVTETSIHLWVDETQPPLSRPA